MPSVLQPYVGRNRKRLRRRMRTSQPRVGRVRAGAPAHPCPVEAGAQDARRLWTSTGRAQPREHSTALPPAFEAGRQCGWTN